MFRQAAGTIDARHRGFFAEAGDARQVWARRHASDGEGGVFFLVDGGVTDEVRRDCADGRLRCPIADCPDPRFIARGGELRRHHFAHRVAHVKHATTAVWRHEAMMMLADWAARYRGAEVDVDEDDRAAPSGSARNAAAATSSCRSPTTDALMHRSSACATPPAS